MNSSEQNGKSFRIIIAGGGITGLALANCLELAGIGYVLLEARSTLTPFVGAGVCLNGGSAPVFDQLGLRHKVLEKIVPLQYAALHYPNGDYVEGLPQAVFLLNKSR